MTSILEEISLVKKKNHTWEIDRQMSELGLLA